MGSGVQPVGRVTLVFTDIESSTRLLQELGEEAYRRALDEHRTCVRVAFRPYRGYEVGCEGDSFFFAFDSPTHAIEAARKAIVGLEDGPIRIRVGVHSGEPGIDPPNYVGLDVHKAARVMAAGHGGQVLLSQATRDLIGDRFRVRYLGEYRLKDMPHPERLYQLGVAEFPPLRTLYHTNLPVPASAFLGRERELAELDELLLRDDLRLLTLAGPGGTGKTRLALQAASRATEQFPDGVWWVPLASLRDPALVVTEVAHTLDIDQPGREPADLLAEVLAGKKLLLVIDNAEHLLPDAVAAFALIRDSAGPMLLVTSRERLQLAGEHVYPVPPLNPADARALYTARARVFDPSFEANAAVDELCARFDNLPLAVELAAARSAVLSPEQILQRLSQRLDLLKAGRDADPRQQTLRSTLEWSHDLLGTSERELFARLSVFAGGCALEAVEQICEADLDALAGLVDKSLLRRNGDRFWMLETIRAYAAERLDRTHDTDALRWLHAGYYERFASDANRGMRGPEVASWFDRVEQELPNLRSAMELSLDSSDPAVALRVSASLARFWVARSPAEGTTWLRRALASGAGTTAERGRGSLHAAALAQFVADRETAQILSRNAIMLAKSAGDTETLAWAYGFESARLIDGGNKREALAMARRCRKLAAAVSDPWARSEAQVGAATALTLGGHDQTAALARELLEAKRELGDELRFGGILSSIGYTAMIRGDYREAGASLEESLDIARRTRNTRSIVNTLGNLGLLAVCEGRYDDAIPPLEEDLRLSIARGDAYHGGEAILGLAAAHAGLGNLELAVKLDTIRKAIDNATGVVHPPALLDRIEPPLRAAWRQVTGVLAASLTETGRELTMDTAIAEIEHHNDARLESSRN